jgi:hypothetical protein
MTASRIRLLSVLAVLGASLGAAIIHAPDATADQYDFIAQLDAQGIFYNDITGAINDGKIVCSELRGHEPVAQIVTQAQNEAGFPGKSAAMFVIDAVNTMCPDVIPWLQDQANAASRPQRDYLVA